MKMVTRFVGMDVHKSNIALAVADDGNSPASTYCNITHDLPLLKRKLKQLGGPKCLLVCYEAGACGFALYRNLTKAGYCCLVIAPSHIPKLSGDRVKTDRRDAIKLARFLRSGDLVSIFVPDEATEALRDLSRAREDAKEAERDSRHQLSKFLLRQDRRYPGRSNWTLLHHEWIGTQRFDNEAHQTVLDDYLHAVMECSARERRLKEKLIALSKSWEYYPIARALMAFRGISEIAALTIVSELGDLLRFPTPRHLMSYVGLTPSEYSSGNSTRRGSITKTGNTHVRRILVESAWSYRFRPRLGVEIKKRNEGLHPSLRQIAWKAQERLCSRYRKLQRQGKSKQKTTTAIARELIGFCWSMAQQVNRLDGKIA